MRVGKKAAFEKRLELTQENLNNYITSCKSLKVCVENVLQEDVGTQPLTLYAELPTQKSTLQNSIARIDHINEVSVVTFRKNDRLLRSFSLPCCWDYEQLDVSFCDQEATLKPVHRPGPAIFNHSTNPSFSSSQSLGGRYSDADSVFAVITPVRRGTGSYTSLSSMFNSNSGDPTPWFTRNSFSAGPISDGNPIDLTSVSRTSCCDSLCSLPSACTELIGTTAADLELEATISQLLKEAKQKKSVWKRFKSRLGFGKEKNKSKETPQADFESNSSEVVYSSQPREGVFTTRL